MVSLPQLPTVNPPKGIEASVVDCYCPLLTLVYYLEGESFINSLIADMEHPSKDIREEEANLETGQILRAIVRLVAWKTEGKLTPGLININIADVREVLGKEYGYDCSALRLSASQRNRIIREDLKFEMRSSHGAYRVYVTIGQLIARCDEWSVQDDLIEKWRKEIRG